MDEPAPPAAAPPPEKVDRRKTIDEPRAKTRHGINYTLAFVLYADGVSLKQIAAEWKVQYSLLADRAGRESWGKLIQKYQRRFIPEPTLARPPTSPEEQSKRFKQIDDNRDKIVGMGEKLRAEIERAIEACKMDPSGMHPKAIAALSKAAKDIAEMSMVALGDEHAVRHLAKQPGLGDGRNTNGNQQPLMIVNLPPVLGSSRRNLKQAEQVADNLVRLGQKLQLAQRGSLPPNDLAAEEDESDDESDDRTITADVRESGRDPG